jgi:hypothetical protein
MFEKQQNKQKRKKVHAVFYQVGFILICMGKITVIKKNKYIPGNLFFVISLSLYLRLQSTSQQVDRVNSDAMLPGFGT